MPRTPSTLRSLCAAACAAAALTAGCGSDDEPAATTSGAAADAAPASGKPLSFFEDRLQKLYAGSYSEPTATGPKPQAGKKVFAISYGTASLSGASQPAGVKEAGELMGWDVTVVDGKFDPSVQLTAIRQAIAAKADGIVLYVIDCPAVKAGLEEAKKAGIAVIGSEANDCSDLEKGQPSLFSDDAGDYNSAPYGDPGPYGEGWIQGFAKAQADALIVATKGKAKVINFRETDSEATLREDQGFVEEMALCGGCEIVETIEFTGADFGPALQQKASQALLQHPDANAIFGVYDSPITSGIARAAVESGRKDEIFVTGGEGNPANVELVRTNRGQNMGVGLPPDWEGWASADALNRVFNGEKAASSGIGLQVWDKDNNLPAKGEFYKAPVDFQSVYKKSWGVG